MQSYIQIEETTRNPRDQQFCNTSPQTQPPAAKRRQNGTVCSSGNETAALCIWWDMCHLGIYIDSHSYLQNCVKLR